MSSRHGFAPLVAIDSSSLIQLVKGEDGVALQDRLLRYLEHHRARLVVPAPVLAEWYRGVDQLPAAPGAQDEQLVAAFAEALAGLDPGSLDVVAMDHGAARMAGRCFRLIRAMKIPRAKAADCMKADFMVLGTALFHGASIIVSEDKEWPGWVHGLQAAAGRGVQIVRLADLTPPPQQGALFSTT